MTILSISTINRIGFALLGLTATIVVTIMFSAAYDLVSRSKSHQDDKMDIITEGQITIKPYCNEQSTSVVLLTVALPSLGIKIIYPYLFVTLSASFKTCVVCLLIAIAFLLVALFESQLLIFTGLVCCSIGFGLAEPHFISITKQYGDSSLSGWSIGTGLAGILGSLTYALLRMALSVEQIMLIMMLVVPSIMMSAYFILITPVMSLPLTKINKDLDSTTKTISFMDKLRYLPSLAKYFFPMLLVYFAEYFINQGLYELIYYPEVEFLDHAAQFRWFLVSYQVGVVVARSSFELIRVENIWAIAFLQCANALLFSAHSAKLIHLPSFYLVLGLTVYEGLLGGFIYVSTFYRIRKEAPLAWLELSISAATVGETLGAFLAGLLALPAHNLLCKLYI